jgi:hypothetical protein
VIVVGGIHHDDNVFVVLGGGSNHRGTAYVDVLDGFFEVATSLSHLSERVQVHTDEIDVVYAVFGDLLPVRLEVAACEQSAVHFRMQRFDAAVENFRRARVFAHVGDFDARFAQCVRGPAGRQDGYAAVREFTRELDDAFFVADAYQRPIDGLAHFDPSFSLSTGVAYGRGRISLRRRRPSIRA